MTRERDEDSAVRQESVPRGGAHPERATGDPATTPEADQSGGRTTFEGGEGSDQARALPDEPLRPQD